MFKIDPIAVMMAVLIVLGGTYMLWLHESRKELAEELENAKTESVIRQKKSEAEIWSRDQLIKIKTKEPHEEVNLSVGTHSLVF